MQAQYARLVTGVDGASECATLRDATGATSEIVFSTRAQALMIRGTAGDEAGGVAGGLAGGLASLSEMSEMQAGGFVVRSLRVGVRSEAFWSPYAAVDDPATTKLRLLVRHLVTDGLTTDAPSEFAEEA